MFGQDTLGWHYRIQIFLFRSHYDNDLMPTYLDLFAGAGGMSLGLEAAGFHCVGAVELDTRAAESYRLNFSHNTVPVC